MKKFILIKRLHLCVLILLGSISVAEAQEQDRLLKTFLLDTTISIAAFSPDGQFVATADRTSTTSGKSAIKVWDVDNGHLISATDDYPVYALTFNSDGSLLAAAGRDGVRLFSRDGRLIRTFSGNQLFAVAFDSLDKTLAAGGAEGEVLMWHVTGTTLLHKFALNKQITSVAFSPDGRLLVAGTTAAPQGRNPIAIWRLSDRKEITSLDGHDYGVVRVVFDSKGQTLVSSGSDGRAVMWRLRNGESVNNFGLSTSKGPVHGVAFSPDDQWIALSADNDILLIKNKTRQQLTLKGHTKAIVQLRFSQDGKTLLSASEDNTIRVWRVE